MTFRFIEGHKEQWPVRLMCHTLEVSAAGYYAWRERPPSFSEQRRDSLLGLIRGVHSKVKHRYGSRRIHAELRAHLEARRTRRVMRRRFRRDPQAFLRDLEEKLLQPTLPS